MTALARKGDKCTGHPCYNPVPYITGSPDVFINGMPSLRQTDKHDVHCCGPSCHDGMVKKGSSSVFANSLPIARQGDLNTCSAINFVDTSSSDSFAGG